jgi:hypothetical protein
LSCCHNFIKDKQERKLLENGKGKEIRDINEKIKAVMEESYLILPDNDYHLADPLPVPLPDSLPDPLPDPAIRLKELANLDLCHVYPEHDICAIPCKPIPEKHQNRILPCALNEHYVPSGGELLYIIQNPPWLSNDGQGHSINEAVQFSIGNLFEIQPNGYMIGYDAVTFKGSSGSPIVFPSKFGLHLIGVHRKGDKEYNWGSLLPVELIQTITGGNN